MKITDVAVAVFQKLNGEFLLASRPEGKPYAGYWEFPGGKIELGESVRDALCRELLEELNVVIDDCTPWFSFVMSYTHATVRLHCWRVSTWHDHDARGMLGLEGQQFAWQRLDSMTVAPTLRGCAPIFRALSLPTHYVITNASEMGEFAYLEYLRSLSSKNTSNTSANGESAISTFPKLIQVREKAMQVGALEDFAREVVTIAKKHQSIVLINSDIELAERVGANGVHLNSSQLQSLTARPAFDWVGASAHTRDDIERAATLGCDFVVLGAVKETRSHPGQPPLGWQVFAQMLVATPVPVFAIGGMHPNHLVAAQQAGAHGVAMQRGIH